MTRPSCNHHGVQSSRRAIVMACAVIPAGRGAGPSAPGSVWDPRGDALVKDPLLTLSALHVSVAVCGLCRRFRSRLSEAERAQPEARALDHSRHSSASLASPFSSQAARRKSDSSFKLLR